MGLNFKGQQYGDCFFITFSFANRRKIGQIQGVYEILAESLNFRVFKTDSKILSYVFMPSHLHFVLSIDGKNLSGFVRDFKKYTAQKHLIKLCKINPVWQAGYDRQAIWSMEVLKTKIKYCHNNPVRANLVENAEDWYYSSYANYLALRNGPVNVHKGWF